MRSRFQSIETRLIMTNKQAACRAGVDIGGTFTDVALEYEGRLSTAKVLTDYEKPERAIVQGLKLAAHEAGIAPSTISTIVHGTTLATNALIARQGARTAFITSDGFRDVIEMRNEGRFEQYDLAIQLPSPLIPRCDRYPLKGRMDANGRELLPLDLDGLGQIIDEIRAGGFTSVAVGLIHSYRNGAHEHTVRDHLVRALPGMAVSISCEVSPQIREFERFNTVCVNAYVKPLMSSYLSRLASALAEEDMRCPLYMMHSGGGLMSLASAAEFPVRLLESGPAGGAIYASHVAARYGLERVLSFDMGGTTAKICLIEDLHPKTARTFEVARTYHYKKGSGMPISIPVIEMVEIGAGGGSIAHVDDLKQIRIGPESAGSEPGPACYGRGGTRPTVTDADLLLAKLDPGRFAGGSIPLDTQAAHTALQRHVADPLGGEAAQAAYAVAEMVDENMSNAARMHAVESGRDLSEYAMIAYGGAAPLHAVRLCEKLGMDRLLVPPGAGVGSAIGFLRAPFGYESLRSAVMRLSYFDFDVANRMVKEMNEEVTSFLRETGHANSMVRELRAYMRYAGQGWEIPVPAPMEVIDQNGLEILRANFLQTYIQLFGHEVAGLDVEVVSWALSLHTEISRPELVQARDGKIAAPRADYPPIENRPVFDAKTGSFLDCAIYNRASLPIGQRLDGPLIVTEKETSSYVSPGYSLVLQEDGCLLIHRQQNIGA